MLDRDAAVPLFYLVKANGDDIPVVMRTATYQPELLQSQAYLLQEAGGQDGGAALGLSFKWDSHNRRPNSGFLDELFLKIRLGVYDPDEVHKTVGAVIIDHQTLTRRLSFHRTLTRPDEHYTGELEPIWLSRMAAVHFIAHHFVPEENLYYPAGIQNKAEKMLPDTPEYLVRAVRTKLGYYKTIDDFPHLPFPSRLSV